MADLTLLVSPTFAPGIFSQNHNFCRAPSKDCQVCIAGGKSRQEFLRSDCLPLTSHSKESWQSLSVLPVNKQQILPLSSRKEHFLIDIQDAQPEFVGFSFKIADKCSRNQKVMQSLLSVSKAFGDGANVSLPSTLMGFDSLAIEMQAQSQSLLDDEFCKLASFEKLHSSTNPYGQVLFVGGGAEMNDLLSVLSDFYLPTYSIRSSKLSMTVPYFYWSGNKGARTKSKDSFPNQIVDPSRISGSINLKPLTKKKRINKKSSFDRDLYGKSYIHAFEALLSVIVNDKSSKTAAVSLKRSGPEIAQLLAQISAGVAGAGLAVLFSVAYKLATQSAPISSTKLLNSGFGLGLVWLSCAVNSLKDAITCSSKITGNKSLENVVASQVEQSFRAICFRAATLMAVALLQFA